MHHGSSFHRKLFSTVSMPIRERFTFGTRYVFCTTAMRADWNIVPFCSFKPGNAPFFCRKPAKQLSYADGFCVTFLLHNHSEALCGFCYIIPYPKYRFTHRSECSTFARQGLAPLPHLRCAARIQLTVLSPTLPVQQPMRLRDGSTHRPSSSCGTPGPIPHPHQYALSCRNATAVPCDEIHLSGVPSVIRHPVRAQGVLSLDTSIYSKQSEVDNLYIIKNHALISEMIYQNSNK